MSAKKSGVLLTNLGTPDAPTAAALKRYLAQFLWDPRVVELPRVLWWLVLHGVILQRRPAQSAKLYQSIWTAEGSPLLVNAQRQTKALRELLKRQGNPTPVVLGMRYGQPSIPEALTELRAQGVDRITVLPLYPQYSCSTTGSTFDAVAAWGMKTRFVPEITFINGYHDHPAYIASLADSVRRIQAQHGRPDKLVISFHGTPVRYREKGDPYFDQCQQTAQRLAEALALKDSDWEVAFQSRFGRTPWLQPYLDARLRALPQEGIHRVQVICPGFSADCLETLEEVAEQNRALFLASGGKAYTYIPALNDDVAHIELLAQLVNDPPSLL